VDMAVAKAAPNIPKFIYLKEYPIHIDKVE
jgi:hypothetical protein